MSARGHAFSLTIAPPHSLLGNFRALAADRKGSHGLYARLLAEDARLRGCVLDVGCGPNYPAVPAIRDVLAACSVLDGLDPRADVQSHPALAGRWQCTLEDANEIPAGRYDALFTYNVVEHVREPAKFLAQAFRVLKPGGAVWAYTPHAVHPFACISRSLQALRLKDAWRRITRGHINDYPAYYRLNRRGSIARHAREAGFASAMVHYVPSVQWDTYFARPLKVLPHVYDRAVGIRVQRAAQLIIFRLEKAP